MRISEQLYRIFKFATNALSFTFWAIILFSFNTPAVAVLTFISAVIHECGHITALVLTGNFRGLVHFVPVGVRLYSRRQIGYRDELLILLAGPVANLLASLLLYLLSLLFGRYFLIFSLLNLFTAISNLMPIEGYDGYKILDIAICMKEGFKNGFQLLRGVSFAFSVILTFLSLYLILKVGEGFWIFGIFFFSLLSRLFKSKNIKKRDFGRFREKKRVI